jgi:hypothetical protein
MAERAAPAIAGRDHLIDVDGFERFHNQPETLEPARRGGRLTV